MTKPEGAARVPWGQQFTPEVFVKKVERMIKPWAKPRRYHPLRKTLVLKKPLQKKVLEVSQPDLAKIAVPYEFLTKLEEPGSWDWVPIRSIIGKVRFALIADEGVVKLVVPLDKKQMIAIGVRQIWNLQRMVRKEYGFDRYLEYIEPKIRMEPLGTTVH